LNGSSFFLIIMALSALFWGNPGFAPEGSGIIQDAVRTWGKPSSGLRTSILVGKTSVSRGEPFMVSVIVENMSGTRLDLQAISAFHIRNLSKRAPESTLSFGSYWCPVNLTIKNPEGKAGPILASPSRLVLEKGASINVSMDLARHGWDKINSSWWPVRDFAAVVGPGNYTLRLDIQVGSGADLKWIRSNDVNIVIRGTGYATPQLAR
jgi:hypothetical protein